MIKIFKLIKNVSEQNIYRLTTKEQRHKQLQIPIQGRIPLVIHRGENQASHLAKG